MYIYSAKITRENDNSWFLEFPAFEGVFADGKTKKQAINDGAEALKLTIAEYLDTGLKLPRETKLVNDVVIAVDVNSDYINKTKCMSVGEASKELGVTKGRISQMLSTGILDGFVFGDKRMVTIASINQRKKQGAHVGRPKKSNGQ